jgi:hypothetical protein
MTIIRLFLAAVFIFILVAVFSFIYLKWWQALLVCAAVLVLFVVAVRVAINLFVRKLGKAVGGMFDQRGQLLKGAVVEVHSVEPAPTPAAQKQLDDFRETRQEQEEDYTPPEGPRTYYRIDVTIRAVPPAPPTQGDEVQRAAAAAGNVWNPHELVLAPANEPVAPEDSPGVPMMVKLVRQFTSGYRLEAIVEPETESHEGDGGDVIEGPRSKRFSFLVGVPPNVRELKFKYYGESFGHIVLPASA